MDQDQEHQIISMPRIGDAASEFKVVTTQGDINFPEDYIGKWVILIDSIKIKMNV
jgi:peroxiredoxin (alkyl hydroperoxide reductase subunit C)